MQHIDALDMRRPLALHAGIGIKGNRYAGSVLHLLAHGEHIFRIDRDCPPEHQALAVVIGERDRLADLEHGAGRCRPYRILVGQLEVRAGRLREPMLGEEAAGRARRRQEHDGRALRIDRLVIAGEAEIIERPALQIDRAFDARRPDRQTRRLLQDGLARLRYARRRRGGRLGRGRHRLCLRTGLRRRRLARHRLLRQSLRRLVGLLRLLALLLEHRLGVEIIPAQDDQHGHHDRQDEIAIVFRHHIPVSERCCRRQFQCRGRGPGGGGPSPARFSAATASSISSIRRRNGRPAVAERPMNT